MLVNMASAPNALKMKKYYARKKCNELKKGEAKCLNYFGLPEASGWARD